MYIKYTCNQSKHHYSSGQIKLYVYSNAVAVARLFDQIARQLNVDAVFVHLINKYSSRIPACVCRRLRTRARFHRSLKLFYARIEQFVEFGGMSLRGLRTAIKDSQKGKSNLD